MSIKEENEVTVKITCSNDELIERLINMGFKEKERFTLDDYFFIPNDFKIEQSSTREILSKAIIVRNVGEGEKLIPKLTFKEKQINEKGEIISQKATNCKVLDCKEAMTFLNAIGYYEIMNIKESDIVYSKDNMEVAIKFIKNSDTLIEIETNEEYDSIEKLKKMIEDIELPIDKNDYFVKKAENELNKILNR